jgi:ribosome small subunit-dependent GTPase A
LERYLVAAHDSGAEPVVLLTKSDISPDVKADLKECKALAPGVPVYAICPLSGKGVKDIRKHLKAGITAVLLGSSGVGKSTLLNRLLEEEVMATQEVRETDSQGRHTTSHRQMFRLDSGALLIDTPGLRELQLWSAGTGVADAFPDIIKLGLGCKYSNCQHGNEPSCAVRKAVEAGVLSEERWDSYSKLKKERAHIIQRTDWKSAREHRDNVKALHQASKRSPKRGRVAEDDRVDAAGTHGKSQALTLSGFSTHPWYVGPVLYFLIFAAALSVAAICQYLFLWASPSWRETVYCRNRMEPPRNIREGVGKRWTLFCWMLPIAFVLAPVFLWWAAR